MTAGKTRYCLFDISHPSIAYNSRMKVSMSEVIAVRRLSREGEPNREVLVSIGKPAEAPDSQGQFYCPIQTVGLG